MNVRDQGGGKMRETLLWIALIILFGIATGEFGFICGKYEKLDHEGRLLQHETKIQVLQSDMRLVKEKVRIP